MSALGRMSWGDRVFLWIITAVVVFMILGLIICGMIIIWMVRPFTVSMIGLIAFLFFFAAALSRGFFRYFLPEYRSVVVAARKQKRQEY
jgi:hypothetical protein